jgi:ammonium transporter, Amt family
MTGVFAAKAWGSPTAGVIEGNPQLMLPQLAGVVAAAAYSAVLTFLILRLIGLAVPLRRDPTRERIGLDVIQHGEEAYSHGEGALLVVEDRRARKRETEVRS